MLFDLPVIPTEGTYRIKLVLTCMAAVIGKFILFDWQHILYYVWQAVSFVHGSKNKMKIVLGFLC